MNRIEELITEQQDRAAACFVRIENLREVEVTVIEVLESSPPDAYWSSWVSFDNKLFLYHSMYANGSIMYDSPVAAELERLESAFVGEFTSNIDPSDGSIKYELEDERVKVTLAVYLAESGTCRRVVTGYEAHTEIKSIEVETAKPIYGVVCGE